ncbi:hypothetical protein D3C76_1069560 [compost metagenome]
MVFRQYPHQGASLEAGHGRRNRLNADPHATGDGDGHGIGGVDVKRRYRGIDGFHAFGALENPMLDRHDGVDDSQAVMVTQRTRRVGYSAFLQVRRRGAENAVGDAQPLRNKA